MRRLMTLGITLAMTTTQPLGVSANAQSPADYPDSLDDAPATARRRSRRLSGNAKPPLGRGRALRRPFARRLAVRRLGGSSRRGGRSPTATWKSSPARGTSRRCGASATCSSTSSGWRPRPRERRRPGAAATAASFSWASTRCRCSTRIRTRPTPTARSAAIYGQYPPLVNASRPPGEWQTYDIVFHRPRFDANGNLTSPARMTILFNGILVQDDVVLTGPTAHKARPPYAKHAGSAAAHSPGPRRSWCGSAISGCASSRSRLTGPLRSMLTVILRSEATRIYYPVLVAGFECGMVDPSLRSG